MKRVNVYFLTWCLVLTLASGCTKRPNELDVTAYTRIASFDGVLNPQDGYSHVDVWVLDHRADGTLDSDAIAQNWISVSTASGETSFRWPKFPLAAGWCEIVDLDGDGWREFLMIERQEVRVVSFRAGAFVYREALDMVGSASPIRVFDVDGDGRIELILGGAGVFDLSKKPSTSLAIARWNYEDGFVRSAWDGR